VYRVASVSVVKRSTAERPANREHEVWGLCSQHGRKLLADGLVGGAKGLAGGTAQQRTCRENSRHTASTSGKVSAHLHRDKDRLSSRKFIVKRIIEKNT
jgi:hypothetical protein